MMCTITFQKAVSGVVCTLAVLFVSPNASGQVLNESAKLLPLDGAPGDEFGNSVSVSGDVAVVGALGRSYNGLYSGAAYVFRRSGSLWVQEQKLLASDRAAGDMFGSSVSVSGEVAVLGAWKNDDNGNNSGSAYVFRWNGSSWVQEQKLLPSDGAADDLFGVSVSVSGDVAVVGAVFGEGTVANSGSAYVFRFDASRTVCGMKWCEEQKLLASDGAANDTFGYSVSISGGVAVVGARWDDDNGSDSGSAYVFRWTGSSWVQEQKLLASDGTAGDEFGLPVFVSGDVAVAGAWLHDANGTDSGSAYVFRWNGSSWVEEQKLLASDGAAGEWFGQSMCVSGNVAVVGSRRDDDNGMNSGAAYVFRWTAGAPGSWVQVRKLLGSDGAEFDQFGVSVSISDDVAIVGAWLDDDNGNNSGSAYVFVGLCPDADGDGVCDSDDVCPLTPPRVAVDAQGRPLGDLDRDCDTDLLDFKLFQRGFTGPIDP